MWPMVLDYTKDECQRMLRKLELEAYAAVVSAFRAQGELTKDKKKTLQELSNILCISLERHRAEIRRAVNDERLNTIAERIVGPNTSSNWAMEGRRLVPLMPRLVPQTAFSALANNVANSVASAQAAKSAAASATASSVAAALEKELLQFTGNGPSAAMPSCSGLNGPTTSPRPLQAAAVVRPSAAWTPPTTSGSVPKVPSPAVAKTEPLPTVPEVSPADEDNALRKRKRSLSLDSLPTPASSNATAAVVVPTSTPTTVPLTANTAAAAVPIPASATPAPAPTAAPLARVTTNGPVVTKVVVPTSRPGTSVSPSATTKIVNLPPGSTTQLRVPVAPQRTTSVAACPQKVILVSTTAAPSPMSSGLQRPPLSVPVVKTVSAPGTTPLVHQGKAPVVMGLQASSAAHPSSPAALTSVTSVVTTPVPSASMVVTGEPGGVRLRPRAVTVNPRMPIRVPRVPAPVLPSMGGGAPQLPCPSPSYGKATISVPKGAIMQYRQEGTVKIIAQSQLPISGAKLVTKAGPGSTIAASSSSSSSTSLNVAPRVSTVSITSNQTRVVNVITASQPGVVRTLSRTVTPGTSGLSQRPNASGLRPMLGSGAKPNVIVVHKAQVWPQAQPGMASSSSHLSRSTDSVTYLQRQDRPKTTVGACGTVTVVKTSVPVPQPCVAPVVRMPRETTVKTVPRLSVPMRKPPEQTSDASSSGGSTPGNSGGHNNNSSLLAELMHAAGILQGEGDSGQPPPLLVIGEDAVPPAEVEVAIDTVPVDDNAVILDDGQLLVDSEAVNVVENIPGVVVEEAPCLLQDHVVCHEVELVTQPGLQLEVVSTSPSTKNSLAQSTQNGQIATKEPGSHKAFPSASSSAEQLKLKSASSDGMLPTPAPKNSLDRPRSPHRKRPGTDDGKDVPGTSNGIVASGVAERLGLMVSGATAIPISSTSKLHATDTAPAARPATNSPAIGSTHAAPPASLAPLNEASSLLRRTDDPDLAVPGPSKVSIVGSAWKHSRKSPLPGASSTAGQHQSNGPQQSIVRIQPDVPVSIGEAPSTSNGPSRVSPDADTLGSVGENSNTDMSDSQSIRQLSKDSSTSSNGNGGPTQSSAENIAEDSAENSVENLVENSEGNSDDNTNDSSQGSSGMVGGDTNEEDSVGPTDLQDSISSSSSAALVYPRNPDEEQSAIISSSSNDHSRRDIHKAKRACDVTSSTSVSASPCPVTPMPSTSAVFGEQSLPVASSTPSVPEQNSPDQTSEGSSTAHFELPSCFGEGNGGSSSNVTSAELEIAVVSSPTPDAQELSANSASGERTVAGSEERRSSAVESSEQEGPAEVSSAIATHQPGASLLPAQREEVTSAQNGNGPSSAASSEVTSAVSCPNFDNDDDDVDGNEAGSLVSELVVSSDEEVSTAEAVLVHSEGLAEITCSTVDATSASIASGSLFHLNTRPLSVSSTEEAEYLGGSVEVDSHENVPDAQAFNDVGTSSSCGDGGEATGAEATVRTLPPVPDEASSDSHSGVESSRTVSTACDSAPAASDHGNPNGTSDQPSQSETGGGFSAASAVEEPVESGNNAEEVYELLICDSEASEGITSVMVDSVSSTVFGAQRGAGPSPSAYHLVSLPSCSSSGPSTSCSPPAIDVASRTLAYHRTDDVANLDASSSSSLSSSNGPPIVADSSAGLPSHDGTPASNSVPGSTSSGSQPLQIDNGNASNNGSGSSSSSGTSSDPATPQNVDDSETYENGAASASSSACDVILVGTHAAGTSSEIVVYAEEEAAASVNVSLDNCDDDTSSNAAPEDVGGNLLIVSSSASGHGHGGLANGMPDEHASTSRLVLHQDEDSAASSAVSDIDAVVGNVVTVETVRDIVEQVVTSSASVTPASLSQPSTSRGTAGPQLALKRKRRVNALIDESLCAMGHVSGWARAASGLLDRVCKFRGANRSKGVPPPAHWFLEPVDPEDAPGYYDVIDQPMDFSTIKKKLESGQYRDITEFHEDMMLVKRNCQTYNPADHEASQDCEEVFAFYLQEYNRLVEKWQKSHLISSPKRSKQS